MKLDLVFLKMIKVEFFSKKNWMAIIDFFCFLNKEKGNRTSLISTFRASTIIFSFTVATFL